MSELEELRQRLEALEAEVGRLREESAATRTLSSMTDRDVAEWRVAMRGHTQTLSALRETQLEQGQALNGLNATVRELAEVVGGIAAGQMQLAEHVGTLEDGQATLLEYVKAQTEQLHKHGRILERLDPGEPES